jgi:hypothetical protein
MKKFIAGLVSLKFLVHHLLTLNCATVQNYLISPEIFINVQFLDNLLFVKIFQSKLP